MVSKSWHEHENLFYCWWKFFQGIFKILSIRNIEEFHHNFPLFWKLIVPVGFKKSIMLCLLFLSPFFLKKLVPVSKMSLKCKLHEKRFLGSIYRSRLVNDHNRKLVLYQKNDKYPLTYKNIIGTFTRRHLKKKSLYSSIEMLLRHLWLIWST